MEPQYETPPVGETAPPQAAPDSPDAETVVVEEVVVDEAPPPPKPPTIGQLRRERKKLWDERQELVYHVGGLAVDLHRRGILDDPMLVALRSDLVLALDERILGIEEQLQEIDVLRRERRARPPKVAGYCMSCGAPYLPDAAFCSRCGARVHVPAAGAEPPAEVEPDTPTQIIEPPPPDAGDTQMFAADDQWTQALRRFEDPRP